MIRIAVPGDDVALCALERAAMSAGLNHVFGDIPFPEDDVLARWTLVLADPAATVLLDEEAAEPVGYAAVAGDWLQHLGVLPAWWGTGRAEALYGAALELLSAGEATDFHLWVLVENERARAFYRRRGWVDTGVRETEAFVPFPVKMQMTLPRSGARPGVR